MICNPFLKSGVKTLTCICFGELVVIHFGLCHQSNKWCKICIFNFKKSHTFSVIIAARNYYICRGFCNFIMWHCLKIERLLEQVQLFCGASSGQYTVYIRMARRHQAPRTCCLLGQRFVLLHKKVYTSYIHISLEHFSARLYTVLIHIKPGTLPGERSTQLLLTWVTVDFHKVPCYHGEVCIQW